MSTLSPVIKFREPCITPAEAARLVGQLESLEGYLGEVTLRGYGAKTFNLGGDLSFVASAPLADIKAYARMCHRAVELFHNLPHTTAYVEGRAVGGGAEAALAARTVILKPGSTLSLPEYAQGHFPFAGGALLAQHHGINLYKNVVRGPLTLVSRKPVPVLPDLSEQWAELMYARRKH